MSTGNSELDAIPHDAVITPDDTAVVNDLRFSEGLALIPEPPTFAAGAGVIGWEPSLGFTFRGDAAAGAKWLFNLMRKEHFEWRTETRQEIRSAISEICPDLTVQDRDLLTSRILSVFNKPKE